MTIITAYELKCDGEGCLQGGRLEGNMRLEWPGLKKEGWTRGRVAGVAYHYCPECSEKRKVHLISR